MQVDAGNSEEGGDSRKWLALLEQCESTFFLRHLGSSAADDDPDELSCAIALECLSQIGQSIPQYEQIIGVVTSTLKRNLYSKTTPPGMLPRTDKAPDSEPDASVAYFKVVQHYRSRCRQLEEEFAKLNTLAAEATCNTEEDPAGTEQTHQVQQEVVEDSPDQLLHLGNEQTHEERSLWEAFFAAMKANDTPNGHKVAYIHELMACTTLGERAVRSCSPFPLPTLSLATRTDFTPPPPPPATFRFCRYKLALPTQINGERSYLTSSRSSIRGLALTLISLNIF